MSAEELNRLRLREAALQIRIADLEEQLRALEPCRGGPGAAFVRRARSAPTAAQARLRRLARDPGRVRREPGRTDAQGTRMRVLIADWGLPAYDRDAGGLRMTWILRLLRLLGCSVTLFAAEGIRREPYASELEALGVEVVAGRRPFRDFAQARKGTYELVMLSRPYVAGPLLAPTSDAFPHAVIVYDTVDLHFLRMARRRELLGLAADAGLEQEEIAEIECIRRSHVTATVSEAEARQVRKRVPNASTVVLPTVHEPDIVARPPFEQRADLLFIGNFVHDPNTDAVLHFANEILPLVTREIDARLWVLGQGPSPEVRALQSPSVIVTGFVPDVDQYFRRARVFVAPLRYGAGVKGKNGQAMAFGLPLVTTSIGAEGMDMVDGRHALIRDEPRDFAQAVIDLYREQPLWEHLSHESQELIRNKWAPEAMRSRLERLISGGELVAPRVVEGAAMTLRYGR